MDKFTYLRSSLSGEALQEINSVQMSDVNYVIAWEMLEKRYENKKLIVKAHLDSLFSIEPIRREGYEPLSRLIGDFDKHLLMLDKFHEPGCIDLIIGAVHYLDLLTDGRQKIADEGPSLQNTVFGWIVSGRIVDHAATVTQAATYSCTHASLDEQLAKFWELENCHTSSTQSVEETAFEAFFDQTTVRDDQGRFVVTLPKRDYLIRQLGESEGTAIRRFLGLERRFQQNSELKVSYADFIREYVQLGNMVQVPVSTSEDTTTLPVCYLPHHAVFKLDSTTTKLSVVFDASCKTSSGVSLNDALIVGPVIQDDLISITLRFRLLSVAIVADVEKM
ncbi:uncharacterized protein LOC134206917 [Armigeres subalbatus]|uniref:uncharacterized protein LOC134206917 n=1 Tax=Armigeres subalbatus TaxID=124917 RepID=UPI002ED4F7D1